MTRRLQVRPSARSDLAEIWVYTSRQWSVVQAEAYLRALDRVLAMLCDQPDLARRYGNTSPFIRIHRFRSHLVIFTADDATLDVIRVVHARSDWQALLSE